VKKLSLLYKRVYRIYSNFGYRIYFNIKTVSIITTVSNITTP